MFVLLLIAAVALGLPLLFTVAVYATWSPPPPDPDAFQLPAGTGARAVAAEWLATVAVLLTRPLRLGTEPGREAAIVFVPETRGSNAAFWLLRRRLRALGWTTTASRAPRSLADLDGAAAALDRCIGALPADLALVLVGHGLGGLAARRYVDRRGGERVRHLVTLATPHQGSAAPVYRWLGAGDLSPAALALALRPAPLPVDVISLAADYDPWLVPLEHADLPGAFNITVRGLGHHTLLFSTRVAGLILENLAAAAAR